jgi:hypothetical protein
VAVSYEQGTSLGFTGCTGYTWRRDSGVRVYGRGPRTWGSLVDGSESRAQGVGRVWGAGRRVHVGSEEGSYPRLIDLYITQL